MCLEIFLPPISFFLNALMSPHMQRTHRNTQMFLDCPYSDPHSSYEESISNIFGQLCDMGHRMNCYSTDLQWVTPSSTHVLCIPFPRWLWTQPLTCFGQWDVTNVTQIETCEALAYRGFPLRMLPWAVAMARPRMKAHEWDTAPPQLSQLSLVPCCPTSRKLLHE